MRYRFGGLELDTDAHRLLRDGEPVKLWPKVFELLRYLVEQRGRLVAKDELLDHVWPGVHLAEGTLQWTISHARQALGQRSGQKLPIETVHRRGYRFSAEVLVVEAQTAAAPAEPPNERAGLPFVGRERVMSELTARLRGASELGRGELCVLVGPPGIGKTRCMDELATAALARSFDVWPVRCAPETWAPAFLPWTLVLRELARARPSLSRRCDALFDQLRDAQRTEEQAADALAARFWWLEGATRLLLEAAGERPIVILLDDLQWADEATLELLTFIAPELRRKPLLVVTTLHADQAARSGRLLRHAYRIDLEPLSESDIAHYVRLVTASDAVRPDTLEAMQRATAGNPLFLEHTLRSVLARNGESLATLTPAAIAPAPIARDTLGTALGRLGAGRELLGAASVLGERFRLSELQALSGLETEALLSQLEPALSEAVVIAEDPSTLRFCHSLMRTVLYDDLPLLRRARLHRQAAQDLERCDALRLGEIAHHYFRSLPLGDGARVAAAAERAARAAASLHAFSDALRFSSWAVEAQALEGDLPPRVRATCLLFHAEMQAAPGAGQDVRATLATVVAIVRAHGLYDLLVHVGPILRSYPLMGALEDPYLRGLLEEALARAPEGANELRIRSLSQLAWLPPYALDIDQSKALSAEALRLARQVGDTDLLLQALNARLHALSGPDDCQALLTTADEMQTVERVPRAWVIAAVFGARHCAHLHRGDTSAAKATLAELGRLAHAHHWPLVLWIHDRLVVQDHIMQGDFGAARTAFEALQILAERWRVPFADEMHPVLQALMTLEIGGVSALRDAFDPELLARGLSSAPIGLLPTLARLLLSFGERARAQRVLEQLAAADFAGVPRDIGYLGALASAAVLAVQLDDRPRARQLYQRLAPYPDHTAMNLLALHEGCISHFLGVLAAYLGLESAEGHFEAAIATNERMGLRPQLMRSCREYGLWLSARLGPEHERARSLLERAQALADALGQQARARPPEAAHERRITPGSRPRASF